MLPIRADKSPNDPLLPMVDDDPGRREWGPLADRPAPIEFVDLWLRRDPNVGLGVIMGNGLVVMDVDDHLFSEFIKPLLDQLDTWVNVTGRGFVHVFLRTDQAPSSGRLLHPEDGRKLADIRYFHSYVGAPPSQYQANGTVGNYAILHGGPEHVRATPNADRVWDALVEAYCHTPVRRRAVVDEVPGGDHDTNIQPPLAEDSSERKRLNLLVRNHTGSFEIRRYLSEGYDIEQVRARYPSMGSHSEVDWMICKELIKHNWTDQEIVWAYATLPLGEYIYRNRERPDHGDRYLLHFTLPKARASLVEDDKQFQAAEGANFKVTRFEKTVHPDDPEYLLSLVFSDGKVGTAKLKSADISNLSRFESAIIRDTDHMPQMYPAHLNNNGFKRGFLPALLKVVTLVAPPREATDPGQLEQLIKRVLARHVTPNAPEGGRFGWHVSDGVAIRHGALMEQLKAEERGRVSVRDVWAVLEQRYHGIDRRIAHEGRTMSVWVVDSSILED